MRSISVPTEGSDTIFASACDQDGVLRVIDIRSNRNGICSSNYKIQSYIYNLIDLNTAPVVTVGSPSDRLFSVMYSPKDSTQLAMAVNSGVKVIDIRHDPNKYLLTYPGLKAIYY